MQGTYFFEPSGLGYEKEIQARLEYFRKRDSRENMQKRVLRYAENAELPHESESEDGESDQVESSEPDV